MINLRRDLHPQECARAGRTKNGWARPAEPLWFLKAASSLAGHRDTVPVPPGEVGRVAYEGELAIVIGRRAHRIEAADAAAHVLGYSCACQRRPEIA